MLHSGESVKYNGKSLIGGGRTVTVTMVNSEQKMDYSAKRRSAAAKNTTKTQIYKPTKDKKKGKRSGKPGTVRSRRDTEQSNGLDSADDLFCKENAEDAKLWTQPPKVSKTVQSKSSCSFDQRTSSLSSSGVAEVEAFSLPVAEQ